MTYPENARRTVVIKASRDTLLLVACAVAATLALSYAVHTRPAPVPVAEVAPVKQQWTGSLADVTSPRTSVPSETMTSASLVVPTSALSLPKEPPRTAPQKTKACDSTLCVAASVVQPPLPLARQRLVVVDNVGVQPAMPVRDKDGFGGRLNPLNHLPDAVRHPFDYAGSTVTGWIKRL